MLRIGEGLSLPVEAATETFLVVGKRGSGKSSTATRLAEQFIRSKVPVAVLDPVDVWWGLKAGAAGEREGGLEVYVFGGEHADQGLALEPTAGVLMADTLVDHRINAVFVLRQFSNKEKARFVSDFAEQLFKRNRDVLHLFCEEAHELMPQNPYAGEEEMLGRMLRLEKLGRTSGIGMTAITQRPASLNKNATTQAEVLIAHRILGAQDVKAIDGWIEHHHQQEQRRDVLASISSLKTGEAWFWAPDFPESAPVGLRRVQVLMPETFDSRRTPKPGERRREPKSLAPVDLEKLGEKMAATRERAKQNDPNALRAEITRLKRVRQEKEVVTRTEHKTVEVAVLRDPQIARLERLAERLDEIGSAFRVLASELITSVRSAAASNKTREDAAAVRAAARTQGAGTSNRGLRPAMDTDRGSRAPKRGVGDFHNGDRVVTQSEGLTGTMQRILDVLAGLEVAGVDRNGTTVGAWMHRHPRNKGLTNALGSLRTAGYVTGFELTEKGRAAAEPIAFDLDTMLSTLKGRERDIVRHLADKWPEPEARENLVIALGLEHVRNKGFTNALGALHSRGLVEYLPGSEVRASDILFPEAIAS